MAGRHRLVDVIHLRLSTRSIIELRGLRLVSLAKGQPRIVGVVACEFEREAIVRERRDLADHGLVVTLLQDQEIVGDGVGAAEFLRLVLAREVPRELRVLREVKPEGRTIGAALRRQRFAELSFGESQDTANADHQEVFDGVDVDLLRPPSQYSS